MVFETFLLNGLTKFRFLNGFDLVPSIPHPHKMGWWTLLKMTFQWGGSPRPPYMIFAISFTQAGLSNSKFQIPKLLPVREITLTNKLVTCVLSRPCDTKALYLILVRKPSHLPFGGNLKIMTCIIVLIFNIFQKHPKLGRVFQSQHHHFFSSSKCLTFWT